MTDNFKEGAITLGLLIRDNDTVTGLATQANTA
jgi:hypothetical protein